jgi:predicted metal-dependent phosphoesterase TrpH
MSGRVDFHVHSDKSSDGDFSPAQLVGFAGEHHMRAISIADHDTVAAYPEAVELGRRAGVEVIPSIEVTTVYDGRELHLLLPFVDWTSPALAEIVHRQTECRETEIRDRVDRIRELGFALTMEEIAAKSNGAPALGVKIAQILLENPENERNPALEVFYRPENRPHAPYIFYKEYFAEGRPAHVPKRFVGSLEVLAASRATGAAPVLATPALLPANDRRGRAGPQKERAPGPEVYNLSLAEQRFLPRMAGISICGTAGSDFHGRIKPHVAFGALPDGDYGMVERLKERRKGAS